MVFRIAAVFAGLTCVVAQCQVSAQGRLDKDPLPLDTALNIDLRNLNSASNWVVAIEVKQDVAPYFVSGLGQLEATPAGIRRLVSLKQVDKASMSVKRGELSLDLANQGAQSVFVYAVVPAGVRIRCMIDGIGVLETTVLSSLLVKNGVVTEEPVRGPLAAIRHVSDAPPQAAPIGPGPNGITIVSRPNARGHLIDAAGVRTGSDIGFSPARVCLLDLEIGTSGTVRVMKSSGNPDIITRASRSIVQWRFTPFQLDGRLVAVRVPVMFTTDSQDRVSVLW